MSDGTTEQTNQEFYITIWSIIVKDILLYYLIFIVTSFILCYTPTFFMGFNVCLDYRLHVTLFVILLFVLLFTHLTSMAANPVCVSLYVTNP